jgi:hypothetical protein
MSPPLSLPLPQLGDLLYKTLFDEAEELRGMFFNLTQVRSLIPTQFK